MGWLWNTTHDIFDIDDGAYAEICICGLSCEQVIAGYNFIRSKSRRLRGEPSFFSYEVQDEVGIDEIGNAAEFVCKRLGKPFHFVSATTKIGKCNLYELGFFILDNAIAIDFQRGPLWGESQIEALLNIILEIRKNATESFLQLSSRLNPEYRSRLDEALQKLAAGDED